jgi:hypothetical protein
VVVNSSAGVKACIHGQGMHAQESRKKGEREIRGSYGRKSLVPAVHLNHWDKLDFFHALIPGTEGVLAVRYAIPPMLTPVVPLDTYIEHHVLRCRRGSMTTLGYVAEMPL